MGVDAVIFDMDGTLLDSSRTVPAAYAAAIHQLSGRHCTDDEVIAQYGAGPATALISHFIGRQAGDADIECWIGHLEARLELTTIYPGVRSAIVQIAAAGLQLGVFTGATRRAAELQLQHGDLRSHFSVVTPEELFDLLLERSPSG